MAKVSDPFTQYTGRPSKLSEADLVLDLLCLAVAHRTQQKKGFTKLCK
jgi:hypothetical protein